MSPQTEQKKLSPRANRETAKSNEALVEASSKSKSISNTDVFQGQILEVNSEIQSRFSPKRKKADFLSRVYHEMELYSRSSRVADCGTFLEWAIQSDIHQLINANFCKDRLCPMCNWRRGLKIYAQVSQVMDVMQDSGYRYLFLTLTIRNVDGAELGDALDKMFYAFHKKFAYKAAVRAISKGMIRITEVTVNTDRNSDLFGTYHPHFHVIIAVSEDYFHKGYISQRKWSELWRECMDLDYTPVCDVRTVKPNIGDSVSGQISFSEAVAEIAKYAVKDSDYLNERNMQESIERCSYLLGGLTNRRLISWYGDFSRVRKLLKLDDAEDGDLLHIDGTKLRSDVATVVIRYQWSVGVGYERF